MSGKLVPGVSVTRTFVVDEDRVIGFMGDDARVYATPALIRDIEFTCRDLILEHVDAGEDSLGIKVSIAHTAPTLPGMEVAITATVAGIEGRKVVLDVSASDPLDVICAGRHERFIVNVAQTVERLKAKAAKAAKS